MFGMSFVNVIFEDGTDIYWARSRVLEYLSSIAGRLPEGVTPMLGPDATGVGWVYEYALVDRTRPARPRRAAVAAGLEPPLRAAERARAWPRWRAWAASSSEYQVDLDPNRLRRFGISLERSTDAVRASNNDVGGRVLEISGTEHFIRGRGYVKTPHDLEQVVLGSARRHARSRCATWARCASARRSAAASPISTAKGEAVGGVVIMRYGENALDVIDAVKARLAEIEPHAAGRRRGRADLRSLGADPRPASTRCGTR